MIFVQGSISMHVEAGRKGEFPKTKVLCLKLAKNKWSPKVFSLKGSQ